MKSGVFYFRCIVLGLLGILQNGWSVEGGSASVQSEEYLPLYSKPLYHSGDTLIIGSLSKYNSLEETFPDFGDPTCKTMESSEYYGNDNYRTNIFNRSSTNNFEVSMAEQNPKVEASEYFVQVGVVAFRCKPMQNETQSGNPEKSYVKIINSMVSIREIYEIKYFSGVSVTKSNCGGRECVLVEETKCLAKQPDNADLVQFKCSLGIPSRTSPPSIVPNLKQKYFAKIPFRQRRYFLDISDARTETISSGGKSFMIGSSSPSSSSEYVVVCQPSTIMNPRIFFPESFQKVGNKYARMNGKQFDESFTVVDERVQTCVNETFRLPEAPKIFYRVQTTVIGKCEVKEIQYGPGISELYALTLPNGTATIRYKDVRFYDGITRERISFKIPFREVEKWRMSSIRVGSERMSSIDIHFKLEHSSVYSTFISPAGYDLQVGSKPVLDVPFSASAYSCSEMENSNGFSTEIKLIISQGQENYAVVKDEKDITFSYISQKTWKCSPKAKEGLTFWRVANRLEMSMPVHMIQSYDGVEIIRKTFGKLEIFEVKYLSMDGRPITVSGEMRFNETIDTAHAISQGYDAISKNEIQPRFIDRIPKRAHNSKDNYRAGTKQHYSILTINEAGTATVNFSMELYAKLQGETLLLVCQPSAVTENISPYFDVENDDSQVRVINNKDDNTLDTKYFTSFVWKSWSCKASQSEQNGQTKEFTRVITDREVNTDAADINSLKRIVYPPVDNAWFDLLSSADDTYKIKLEGIRYYQHNAALKDPVDFDGYSILEEAQSSHTNNLWKSGTKTLEELPSSKVAVYTDHSTEVYYDLNEGRSYMLHLPGDQASAAWNAKKILRIGSKWKEAITLSAGRLYMLCRETDKFASDDNNNFLHTKVQIYSQGNNEEVEEVAMRNSHHGKTRVWICSDNEKTILRVKNNFLLESTIVENIKTIEYIDGVAVFSGERNGRDVFEIVEVKYFDSTVNNVVKYEGPLVFPSSDDLGLCPNDLDETNQDVAIQDVKYILSGNEYFKTNFDGYFGETLEIGGTYDSLLVEGREARGSGFKIKCVEMTKDEVSRFEMKVSNEGFKDQLLPKVVLLKRNEGVKEILPTKLDKENLTIEFDFSQRLWKCSEVAAPTGRTAEILYRVRSRMTVKASKINRFYHRDDVKVMLENEKAVIIHIMYLSESSTTYTAVRFEGLVIFAEDVLPDIVTFKYHLDQPILQFEAFNATQGITIEVTSQWNEEIENIDGEIVTCEIHKDSPVRPAAHKETEILVNENSDTENSTHTWKVMDSTLKTFFETKIYEEWSCKSKDYEFSRVVNKLITTRDDIRVYYPAGVKVGALSIYNNKKALQITQEKFFKAHQPIKYIGKLKLVRKTVVGAEEFLGSFHNDIETSSLNSEPKGNITWTLDSMRFCASKDFGVTNTSTDSIKFDVQQGHLQTYYIPDNKISNRIFQLGRFWTKELNSTGEMMKCYLFKWDEHKPRYTPRVAEYIDQKLYTLTRDEFDELFTITEIKVWLCTNKEDEFLKVYTVYESTRLAFAVRYTDGIKVEMQHRGDAAAADKKALVIHETVYLDTMSSLVYRYDATDPLKEYVVESAW